ncbi:unnamed protein product [Periconia digitata]|uniref:Enoyl reductase (ER) domain-containing protein n=1 Tax=Periconia digitata TaxID=1303443 RepID=A0A9W4UA71_9PLEO|nr:unnamed protein product [Periconia digitata]
MATTMKAWHAPRNSSAGLEKELYLPPTTPKPTLSTPSQMLVRVHAASINPADHKVPETRLLAHISLPDPFTPGQDFSGTVAELGSDIKDFAIGDAVFGSLCGKLGRGSLGEYIIVEREMVAKIPSSLATNMDEFAGIGVAGLTAFQAIVPNVSEGKNEKVFINGGSGGTGVFAIQIAKALGCFVTTTCSATNVELCKSLGADEVLDYTKVDVVEEMKKKGKVYKLVMDNVGTPENLYWASNAFLVEKDAKFEQIGANFNLGDFKRVGGNTFLPAFLGGGRSKYAVFLAKPSRKDLERIAGWMEEGKVKTVVDSVFEFGDATEAFKKLKTGRAKGKVIVRVRDEKDG